MRVRVRVTRRGDLDLNPDPNGLEVLSGLQEARQRRAGLGSDAGGEQGRLLARAAAVVERRGAAAE